MKKRTIALCVLPALLSFAGFARCADGGKDNSGLALLALAALLDQTRLGVTLSSNDGLASFAAAPAFASDYSSQSALTAPTANIAGVNLNAYGDGAADGFTDRFITPSHAGLNVSGILAWKRVAGGAGVASGAETLGNSDLTILPVTHGHDAVEIALAQGVRTGVRVDPAVIAELSSGDYDRIGIQISSVVYFLPPAQAPDAAYRYIELAKQAGYPNQFLDYSIHTRQFTSECPPEIVTTPTLDFYTRFPRGTACALYGGVIHADGSGIGYVQNFGNDPGQTRPAMHNHPAVARNSVSPTIATRFKFSPTGAIPDFYIIPLQRLAANAGEAPQLTLRVSADHAIFWDSNDDDIFAPDSEGGDRPNANDGVDNESTPSRRNFMAYLPAIVAFVNGAAE